MPVPRIRQLPWLLDLAPRLDGGHPACRIWPTLEATLLCIRGAKVGPDHRTGFVGLDRGFGAPSDDIGELASGCDGFLRFGAPTAATSGICVIGLASDRLEKRPPERRVAIELDPAARAWLAETGYDPVYGARPLARVIQTEVRDPLTDEILFGALENGGTAAIVLGDGKLDIKAEPRNA